MKLVRSAMKPKLRALLRQAEEGYLIPCLKEDGSIDLFARASSGDTLLHVAVGQRDLATIRFLLEAGLDINARGDLFETPLYSAASRGDLGLVAFLLRNGADPEISNNLGELPVDRLFDRMKKMPEDFLQKLSKWIQRNSKGL